MAKAGGSIFTGSNPVRARASGLLGRSASTQSVTGELLGVVIVELLILAALRQKFRKHHGG